MWLQEAHFLQQFRPTSGMRCNDQLPKGLPVEILRRFEAVLLHSLWQREGHAYPVCVLPAIASTSLRRPCPGQQVCCHDWIGLMPQQPASLSPNGYRDVMVK